MKAPTEPTERALLKWWAVKAAELRAAGITHLTCADCGRVDALTYVQPQHPYYADGRDDVARCGDCLNAQNAHRRDARRAQLAARPKDCERCGRRPHTFIIGPYRLCGRCKRATMDEHWAASAKVGALAIFATSPMVDTRAWASLETTPESLAPAPKRG